MRLLLPANVEAMDFLNHLTLDNMTYRRVEITKKINHFLHIQNDAILLNPLNVKRISVMILNPVTSEKRILPDMEKHRATI
jgi:hypothetical protein